MWVAMGESSKESGLVVPSSTLLLFLEQVQQSALATFGPSNFDPKHYVDLPLLFNLSVTRQAFQGLPNAKNLSTDDFNRFLKEYFGEVGSDLVNNDPPDFSAEPQGFLPGVVNQEVRKWALEVHSLWNVLSRKVGKRVAERPDEHTLLPLPGGVIIPGSRFREVYYWDSYWIIRYLSMFTFLQPLSNQRQYKLCHHPWLDSRS
jgi:alpha,alpha-trehalase